MNIIVTCEHAGNNVPDEYSYLFGNDSAAILASHRGWDPGAWDLAVYVSDQLSLPAYACHTSRLLIEVNRSLHHRELFSPFSSPLSFDEKQKLIRSVYVSYREPIERLVTNSTEPLLHLSVHTFTPVLDGKIRGMEIGLLFDPERDAERVYSNLLQAGLERRLPDRVIRFNEPYRGADDGFTTYLRSCALNERYAGIELEINQKLLGTRAWPEIRAALAATIGDIQAVS